MIGTPQRHDAGSYAAVNGIKLYYDIHGAGRPLVLHGGPGIRQGCWGSDLQIFGPVSSPNSA